MENLSRELMYELAGRTYAAEKANCSIEPVTDTYPDITLEQAYAIQIMREEQMTAEGHRVIGGKMGLTSFAKMKQMGMTKSTYGRLFDYMLLQPEEDLRIDECIHPRVESEIAFVLKEDLRGPYITSVDVMNATEYVSPAFEIIDSRYHEFKFRLCDGVMDNISAKKFKLSAKKFGPKDIDLITAGVTISVNGEDRIFGAGGAVLGHPARAVAAYANLLAETGRFIKKGDIVLSGAITAATPVKKGDYIKSEFLDMGFIDLHVV